MTDVPDAVIQQYPVGSIVIVTYRGDVVGRAPAK